MKSIVKIDAAKRKWNIHKDKSDYILKIMNGKEEIIAIGPLPENILNTLIENKIIDK